MFTLLAGQRSGTHLLATLLNSHPELRCYEEVLLRSISYKNRNEILGEKHPLLMKEHEGGIVMYDHFVAADEDTARRIKRNKIIHLTRNIEDRLRSLYGIGHKDCFNTKSFYKSEEEIFVPEPPERWKKEKGEQLEAIKLQALDRLTSNVEMLEVSYEDLTGGKSTKGLSERKAAPLCNFLGVKTCKLETDLRKPKYVRPGEN